MFPVNTYVLHDEVSKEAIIIDPGCYYPEEQLQLKQYLAEQQLHIKQVIQTHLHLDHIFGTAFLAREYSIKPMAHREDEFLIEKAAAQCHMFGFNINETPSPLGGYIEEGDTFSLGDVQFKAIHTPGHSPGGICYYCEKQECLFSGDTLFKSGLGRTDFEGGSYPQIADSIKNKLFALPDNTIVYPGHGLSTTIRAEKTSLYL